MKASEYTGHSCVAWSKLDFSITATHNIVDQLSKNKK